ncbi:MAG: Phosphatidylinositolglycan class N-domain-containing protein [Piptocephalis tieghemiana]|nr:MAG: Phosphatidylinositolglycan class N-domain-containing protein [Piptocephalis tieghemiana]
MTPYRVTSPPAPAKRLVLAVADGLRADRLFEHATLEDGEVRAPFLHDIIHNRGSWGVSHTRVPTESRPGHVAVIAGFYEDVSAVTKGWKMNPVEFDSVFNRSTYTWSYGSPDILPMFREGATRPERIVTGMYDADLEDFATEASHLDEWVFQRMEELFASATSDSVLANKLSSDGIVFFLHLLGLDTNGHAFRPHSPEYLRNIRVVDAGIRRMEQLIENYYGHDGRTAYVFTSDHGMGNRGAHGDGDPDNTRTPLIAWGAGVAGPEDASSSQTPNPQDDLSASWTHLANLVRKDVGQADIAPLMSSLLGLEYPVNSVGVLPTRYLGGTSEFRAVNSLVNARQVLAQYRVKEAEKESTEILFRPFTPLAFSSSSSAKDGSEARLEQIQEDIQRQEWSQAEEASHELIHLCLQGLRYFQTYDWFFLRSIISAGYLGWIVYSVVFVLRAYGDVRMGGPGGPKDGFIGSKRAFWVDLVFVSLAGLLAWILWYQHSPAMYYVYTAFPLYFWREIAHQGPFLLAAFRSISSGPGQGRGLWLRHPILVALVYIGVLEALVYSYFYRPILSIGFVAAGLIWPLYMPGDFRRKHGYSLMTWSLSCLACSIFPSLAVEKGEDLGLVMLGGLIVLLTGLVSFSYASHLVPEGAGEGEVQRVRRSVSLQLILILLSLWTLWGSVKSLQAKQGLPYVNQWMGWAILIFSSIYPFLPRLVPGASSISGITPSQDHYLFRLVTIYLAFAPPFLLLCISYEALFYASFSLTLLLWLFLEYGLYMASEEHEMVPDGEVLSTTRPLRVRDVRTAAFFLFFVNVAFFGTGNVASISSFSIESVYRLTTVFDPFLMGALLIGKILIPFLLLSAVFGLLSRAVHLPPFSLFLLVLSTTDVMTLNFFYLVRDDGSWLEIGMSISHFCISSGFVVFTILLFWVSHLLVGKALLIGDSRGWKRRVGPKET